MGRRAHSITLAITLLIMALISCIQTEARPTPNLAATAAAITVVVDRTEQPSPPQDGPDPNAVATQAVQTAVAQFTQSAQATSAMEPSPTNTPTATPTEQPCTNMIQFVADVTVPDGTYFAANAAFVKTWRLRNVGTCTWTQQYALVFDSGTAMGGPPQTPLPAIVPPGASIDLSVNQTAPNADGSYAGYWKLRSGEGVHFGWGDSGTNAFWVKINVGLQPSFTAAFDTLNGCVGWYPDIRLVNTGGLTFRSVFIEVVDNDTGTTVNYTENAFDKTNGCIIDAAIPQLPPGGTGYAHAYDFIYDPTGHDMTAFIRVCSLPGLGGVCAEATFDFIP